MEGFKVSGFSVDGQGLLSDLGEFFLPLGQGAQSLAEQSDTDSHDNSTMGITLLEQTQLDGTKYQKATKSTREISKTQSLINTKN